jgi:hypothetical protein
MTVARNRVAAVAGQDRAAEAGEIRGASVGDSAVILVR